MHTPCTVCISSAKLHPNLSYSARRYIIIKRERKKLVRKPKFHLGNKPSIPVDERYSREDELEPRPRRKTSKHHSHGLNFFNTVVCSRQFVLVVRKPQGTGFRGNRMQGMEGRADPQPLIGPDFGRSLAQGALMNQASGAIHNEQV